ncbi:hypothetical protein PMI34_02522 [Pseudomonas sp. GM74]|uniref:trypsin-like serine peptidase n=1 Tax=Pseudomonas sp. GM74 TaxID=1144336 RepID=UPI000270939E|nr:trypsin-like peptidase domain-containing protein [Pseudomonas sp. GM74]EJM91395.1 hypothetical protein PMI34_02522 [Pseudomonas sp. GM74]
MECSLFAKLSPLFFITLVSLNPSTAVAVGKQQDWGEGTPNFSTAEPLNNSDGKYDHWQSIGRVEIQNGMTCSGTLIDTRGRANDMDGPAYVLTSGHCNNLNPDVVLVNADASGSVIFNYFRDTADDPKSYPVTKINWSTIRGQDISIVQLDRTIGQLISDGVQPLKLASALPTEADILIIGAPMEGHVQRMACPREHSAGVIEGLWAWQNQVSNRCLDVVSGISGSPVLGRYNNEVLAVVGTTTRGSGQSRCNSGAPCEVVNGQVSKSLNTNYTTPTVGLQACFKDGLFNRNNGQCSLGPAFTFSNTTALDWHKLERDHSGQVIPWLWVQSFGVDRPYFRYKFTRTLAECGVPGGYSKVFVSNSNGQNEVRRELVDGAGMYLLCVMGQKQKIGPPGQWDARNARIYWRWMLEGPNKLAPIYSISKNQGLPNEYSVRTFPVTPDLDAYKYQYKAGKEVDCLDENNYVRVPPSIGVFEIDTNEGTVKVCLKTTDLAGNPSPIADFQVPE